MSQQGVRVRVILDTEHLGPKHITMACWRATGIGVWMVQGGCWRGQRAGLSQVELMREALGQDVLLKWTHPVRSLETMLLCIAQGIGRFNGDVDRLMTAAHHRTGLGPVRLPIPGTDYGPVTRKRILSMPWSRGSSAAHVSNTDPNPRLPRLR